MTAKQKAFTADEAYRACQAAFGMLEKNATNPHFRSKYADLPIVIATCRPVFHEHGFTVKQRSEWSAESTHFVMRTELVFDGEIYLTDTVPLLLKRGDMQDLGSALTYSRRYGLLNVSGLAPEDDDGNAASQRGRSRDDTVVTPASAPTPRNGGNHPNAPADGADPW